MIEANSELGFFLLRGGEPPRFDVTSDGNYRDFAGRVIDSPHIKSDRFRRLVTRPNGLRDVELLPGVSSLSKEVVYGKVDLAEIMRKSAVKPQLERGFKLVTHPGHVFPTDTAGIRTVSAQMDPELCIRAYNRDFVSVPTLSRRYAELGVGVFVELFGERVPSGFTFRRDTSSGPYTFQREPDQRVALFTQARKAAPLLSELAWAVSRGKRPIAVAAARALTSRDLTPSARIIRRMQVDSAKWVDTEKGVEPAPNKVREGEDWQGKPAIANKIIVLFQVMMLLSRSRGAWSVAAGLNFILQMMIGPMRKGMLTAWHRLFMPLDESSVLSYIRTLNASAASFDAKNCDQHHPPWAPPLFAAMMEACGYGKAAAWLEFFISFGPVVQTNDHVFGVGMNAFGLPGDPYSWLVQGGNKSGISTNELKNKWLNQMDQINRGMIFGSLPRDVQSAIRREMLLWREDMAADHPMYEWSGGDNILVIGRDSLVKEYGARLALPRGKRFIFDYSQDPYVDFDGHEFVKLHGEPELWPSVKRAMDKLLCREYSWSRKSAPATGALEVIRRIRSVFNGDAVVEPLLRMLSTVLGRDLEDFLQVEALREATEAKVELFSLTDLEVMDDPSKLLWKPGYDNRATQAVKQHFLHSFEPGPAQAMRDQVEAAAFPSFVEFFVSSLSRADRAWFERILSQGVNRHGRKAAQRSLATAFNRAQPLAA